jgi:predicted nucleotidyltransferase
MTIKLKKIRENIGLTQEQVSELTGVPVKTLRNWEQEIRKPSEWTMDLIIDKILTSEMNKNLELNDDGDDETSVLSYSLIKKEVTEVAKDLDIEKVYLFGSYVKGDMTALSDIDLYMQSDIFGLDYYGVVERFRNALHKKVDLLSNKTLLPDSKIYDEIMETGVVIYERR